MSFYSYKKDEDAKPGHGRQAMPGLWIDGAYGKAPALATFWQPWPRLFYLIKPP